jgi:crotonobetainyl-CoA:carnitine CoA-transferase CaiB-like acyl-CoA transferase
MTDTPLPLAGVRVLDMSRILAGPTATQLLGDLGADVIKIERPGAGDDTRKWGPPFVEGWDGKPTKESAYYLSANRNKRSVTVNVATPEGQALIKRLLAECDVMVQNYKVGGLTKYGLSYEDLKDDFPGLVYCSVSGFGQTGPYAKRAGYDFLAQGAGGIMSITGPKEGPPMKVGVGIADVMCGMYAATTILAALRYRDQTGKGQHLDCSLLDTQVSWLTNEGTNYLLSGKDPVPQGNEHPNIVPYAVMESADGHFILAVGNDTQFRKWCDFAGADDLKDDPRYATNSLRVANREPLYAAMPAYTKAKTSEEWITGLSALGVPCGPIKSIKEVFEDPQVIHRDMRIEVPHHQAASGVVPLIGNPVKLSETPVQYRHAPPTLGQHTDEVLREVLGCDDAELARLAETGATSDPS